MSRFNAPPSRWNQYNAIKDVIEGTRFLPFKTPFKRPVRRDSGHLESFNGSDLLKRVGNLGLVLNLANTDRYYNPQVYVPKKVEYHQERLSGGGRIPTDTQIYKTFELLDRFALRNQDDNVKLVGVHCTHGVNRTGYLICRYMICKLGFEPGEAIRRFEQGRGHPFDHQEYVENLRSLEPAEDISMKQWHSIGGRIIGGVDDDEEESFDPDQLENLGRRSRQWRRKSPERTAAADWRHDNCRQDDRRQDARRQDARRQDDRRHDDRHQRRHNSSSSSRSRRKDRSRSPSKTLARDDRRRYERDEEVCSPTSDRLWRYVGPRTSRGAFFADSYLGPPRHKTTT